MARASLWLWALGTLLLARPAAAIPVTWSFEGTIEQVFGANEIPSEEELGIVVGDLLSGILTFDTDAEPRRLDATVGYYPVGTIGGSFTIGDGYRAEFLAPGQILIADHPFAELREHNLVATDDLPTTDLVSLTLSLSTQVQGTFRTDFLDPEPPPLSVLDPFQPGADLQSYLSVGIRGGPRFRAEITRLERVPEPAGLALVALLPLIGARVLRRI